MKWTTEAEGAVSRAPFFIRKRVKKRVEEEAERQGSSLVTLDHVRTCQQRFLKNMDAEVKGFQVEACFGPTGCPNACSRPQIVDFGIIGALRPRISNEPCTSCGACREGCSEGAITLEGEPAQPVIDFDRCLACGQCLKVCPTGTLAEGEKGNIEAALTDLARPLKNQKSTNDN